MALEEIGKRFGEAVANKQDVDAEHMHHSLTCEHCIREATERAEFRNNMVNLLEILASNLGYKVVPPDDDSCGESQ